MTERLKNESVLDMRTHFKPRETFQDTFFTMCNPRGVKKGLAKGEALRLLRTKSSKGIFEDNIKELRTHLLEIGSPIHSINKALSQVKFEDGHRLSS